jgi:hypothetical protein
LRGAGRLKLGPQPPNEPGALFSGASGVEFDQAEEDVLGGKIGRPAVSFGDGEVEVVVDLAEDRDEAAVVNDLTGGAEGLAGAEFLQDVVHLGKSQVRVQGSDASPK